MKRRRLSAKEREEGISFEAAVEKLGVSSKYLGGTGFSRSEHH
jgi:hypothetical protein